MATPKEYSAQQISEIGAAVLAALNRAVRRTLIEHKRAGDPIVIADENGLPRWVPAEEIIIPDEPAEPHNKPA